jgi:hypothetical protein
MSLLIRNNEDNIVQDRAMNVLVNKIVKGYVAVTGRG